MRALAHVVLDLADLHARKAEPDLKMIVLSPLASIYEKITELRNRLYDTGRFASFDLGARTISIGNITTGGTGKTPIAGLAAEMLADAGHKVCILSRGYGRKSVGRVVVSDSERIAAGPLEAGDEPVELAMRLGNKAIVIVDKDRVAAAGYAKERFGVTAFVLDDGSQHRRARRDVDIICIDATDPFGGGRILPAGRLREPLSALERSDAIIITRTEFASDLDSLRRKLLELAPKAAVFTARTRFAGLLDIRAFLDRGSTPRRDGEDARYFSFCGIGNPESFFALIRAEGFDVVGTAAFRDHHAYNREDVSELVRRARAAGADSLITTAKDAVRLKGMDLGFDCQVVMIDTIIEPEAEFRRLISS